MTVAAGAPYIVDDLVDLIPERAEFFFGQQLRRSELIHLKFKAFIQFPAAFPLGTGFLDRQANRSL